jgi:hypothetical protein
MAKGRKVDGEARGWEVTEYLILLALIAIAAIGVVSLFGDQLQELFSGKPPESQTQIAPVDGSMPPAAQSAK